VDYHVCRQVQEWIPVMVKGEKKKVGEEDHNWLKGAFFSCEVFANAMIGATKQRGLVHVAFFVDQRAPRRS
jgi:hypothetical protein